MTYVIIGAGPAGVVAAETLRKADPSGDIVMIGDEAEPPYSRMAIPYLLTGMIDEAGTYLRKAENHYQSADISYRQGRIQSVDSAAKQVVLEDGSRQSYSKLLIATGASPIKPPISGLDQPGVYHCWTLEDARQIMATAGEGDPVLLIGAGFIACIILEALISRGVRLRTARPRDPGWGAAGRGWWSDPRPSRMCRGSWCTRSPRRSPSVGRCRHPP